MIDNLPLVDTSDILGEPRIPWLFDVVNPILFVVVVGILAFQHRNRTTLSIWALMMIGFMSTWWQEWPMDWAIWLLYNSELNLFSSQKILLDTPNKPWSVITAYGWFYILAEFVFIFIAVSLVRRGIPLKWTILLMMPLAYVWDFIIEGGAAYMGYWQHANPVGPVMHTERGDFNLIWPISQYTLIFSGVATWLYTRVQPNGEPEIERSFGIDKLPHGWNRELRRVGLWVIVLNSVSLAVYVIPFIITRLVVNAPPNAYVP